MKLRNLIVPIVALLALLPMGEAGQHVPPGRSGGAEEGDHPPLHRGVPPHRPKAKVRVATRKASRSHVSELRSRGLVLPVEGTDPEKWKHSFFSARGSKMHNAVDMRAPLRTPVRAVQDGRIARMNTGRSGGISIYQTDTAGKYNFYYCHLHGYASGLRVGQNVRKGQVIGYVGSTGHSFGPHLHFQISKIVDMKRLWAGFQSIPTQFLPVRPPVQ